MKLNRVVSASPSPLSAAFDATLKQYRISAKELSKLTGVSENHISEFRRGKGDVSTNVLSKLMDGMETLAAGSKQHLCRLMTGKSPQSLKQSLIQIIQVAEEDELLDAMGAIASRFRYLRNCSDDAVSQPLMELQ
jgi:transcriptional regulator with XRE-family HTH domain